MLSDYLTIVSYVQSCQQNHLGELSIMATDYSASLKIQISSQYIVIQEKVYLHINHMLRQHFLFLPRLV